MNELIPDWTAAWRAWVAASAAGGAMVCEELAHAQPPEPTASSVLAALQTAWAAAVEKCQDDAPPQIVPGLDCCADGSFTVYFRSSGSSLIELHSHCGQHHLTGWHCDGDERTPLHGYRVHAALEVLGYALTRLEVWRTGHPGGGAWCELFATLDRAEAGRMLERVRTENPLEKYRLSEMGKP